MNNDQSNIKKPRKNNPAIFGDFGKPRSVPVVKKLPTPQIPTKDYSQYLPKDWHTLNWIDKFTTFMDRITDAPSNLKQAVALSILSSALGRNWVFMSAPDQEIFRDKTKEKMKLGKLLNLWFLVFGKSRISRKTTCLNKIREILDELGIHQLSNVFTTEALIDEMAEKGREHAIWLLDECSSFFEACDKKQYMNDAQALLSALKDGNPFARHTKGGGLKIIRNPYLTVILASTEYVTKFLNEDMFRQGFLNRFIFVHAENVNLRPERMESLTDEELAMKQDIWNFIAGVYDITKRYDFRSFSLTDDAHNLMLTIDNKIDEQVKQSPVGTENSYRVGLSHVLKQVAAIHFIARAPLTTLQTESVLYIEKSDMEWAHQYIQGMEDAVDEVKDIREMISSEKGAAKDYRSDQNKLIRAINFLCTKNQSQVISLTALNNYVRQKYGWSADERNKILETLLSTGEVIKEQLPSTGGKRKTVVRLNHT